MTLKPFSDAPLSRKPETFAAALKPKQPWIGLTQGGSSGKFAGARVAARDADIQKHPRANKE